MRILKITHDFYDSMFLLKLQLNPIKNLSYQITLLQGFNFIIQINTNYNRMAALARFNDFALNKLGMTSDKGNNF